MNLNLRSAGELSAALDRVNQRFIPELGAGVLRLATRELFEQIARKSPVGSTKTSRHPGKYAASHRAAIGEPLYVRLPDQTSYMRLGVADVSAILPEISVDRPVFIANWARSDGDERGYSDVLEAGRHVDSRGRMAGSVQAPDGIYGPAVADLETRGAAIMEQALGAALRALAG